MTNETNTTEILDCGHPPVPTAAGYGTGITILLDGRRVCYTCADDLVRKCMTTDNWIGAYLSGDGARITTWSGGTLAHVTRRAIRPVPAFGRRSTRVYWRAVDATGTEWYGQSAAPGMITRMRRAKGGAK